MKRLALRRSHTLAASAVATLGSLALSVSMVSSPAHADARPKITPGNLLVSRLHYVGTADPLVPGTTVLPTGATAVAGSDFAHVWDNVDVDANFGVTAPIYLDQLTPGGTLVSSTPVPTGAPGSTGRGHDVLSGSFSSKSEGALNLSTGGDAVTFMGYVAPAGVLDASNGNTPGVVDPTNPDTQQVYRGVGELDTNGKLWFTQTNAYSGDNGRAAILDDASDQYFTAGNSNNGANTSPAGLIYGTGAQMMTPQRVTEDLQQTGQPTPAGGFSILQIPGAAKKADKLGKDTNFAGVTIHDGVVYYTKGSGSNGIDTVYFIDTSGTACPNGVGVPATGASVPTQSDPYDATTGEPAHNMCVLKGFPTAVAKSITTPEVGSSTNTTAFGGMWFANDHTLYVGDSGNGNTGYDASTGTFTAAAQQNLAGIQKWSLVDGTWTYDYTLQAGLDLGVPYAASGLPTGTNDDTGLPWSPATDGIRNLTGKVNADGSVTLYGVTTTIGGVSDPGADPNKLVTIADQPDASSPADGESFSTLATAGAGDVYRGVSLTPGS